MNNIDSKLLKRQLWGFLKADFHFHSFIYYSVRPNPLFWGSAETETEPEKITETEPNRNRTEPTQIMIGIYEHAIF